MNDFDAKDLTRQELFSSDYWIVIFPQKPINASHLLFVRKGDERNFHKLPNESLIDLNKLLATIIEKVSARYGNDFDGYNLFSNNGSERIGQHMNTFHQHIFLRMKSENESPYAVMTRGDRWFEEGTIEWNKRKDELKAILS